MTRDRRRIILCATAAMVAVSTVICGLFVLGVARPPWVSEADWHLVRYYYWRNETGTADQRERHRQALIALGPKAVPPIAERVVTSTRKEDREIAVYLLRDLGRVANRAIEDMLADPELQFDGVSRTDQERRLLYAQFAAFRDWDAFDRWLSHMEDFGGDLFDETQIEHHIDNLQGSGIPEYSMESDDRWVVNPAFAEWWRSNRASPR